MHIPIYMHIYLHAHIYIPIETYVFILIVRKYNINNVNHRNDNSKSKNISDHIALKIILSSRRILI